MEYITLTLLILLFLMGLHIMNGNRVIAKNQVILKKDIKFIYKNLVDITKPIE